MAKMKIVVARDSCALILPLFLIIMINSFLLPGILAQNTSVVGVKVGVVLDLESPVVKVWQRCINMSISDFYASHPYFKTRLLLHFRDSDKDVITAASAALELINEEQVEAILGPSRSNEAKFMIEIGQKSQVPIVSFSATDPSLTTTARSPYFFRAAINDSSQVDAISSLASAFNWRQVVPIYADTDYGHGIVPYLVDSLQAVGSRVPYRSVLPPSPTDDQIETELYKLMTMQTRVFVVHMWKDLGVRLFSKAAEIGMMDQGFVWITTNDMTGLFGSLSPLALESMQGVLGVKTHVPKTPELESFRARFRRQNPGEDADVMGLWAYDSAFALALAVEKTSRSSTSDQNDEKNSTKISTGLGSFRVSQNGPRLSKALLETRFRGVAGDFELLNGQLQLSTFEVVNLNGIGGRTVGFWTPENGLTRRLNDNSSTTGTLGPIIWPGESTVVPKGWETPTNSRRLRIGVPVKEGFKEFVDVERDGGERINTTHVTGFSIDVFEACVRELNYALPFDYIPFANPDGTSAGTYDELVYQVFLGNYDAVVSDSTIRENRSKYVDFTLPYTDSGVVMVVPLEDDKRKSAWVFLEPLTWDLWVTSACFFVFIGFVVWILEHRINPDFRGPPSHQVGTSFWFSFSTMVFAHKERVISNLARFVVIIWVFVVLILTQSYTASLTSLLTVERLQPTITDFNRLVKSGDRVGYLDGSFVYSLLRQSGLPDSRIVPYKSAEECDELLSKGSSNGGISAAIDETPNIKLFLSKFCSKYISIGAIFKTAGFGFVFPKGSPLVAEISRAILNVTEGDEMKKIENKWLKQDQPLSCQDSHPKISANNLSLSSFWGLFLIAGVASSFSLLVFAITFLHKHRAVLLDSTDSVWTRIKALFINFDQKDLSSHTFRKNINNIEVGREEMSVNIDFQNSTCPPSPSSHSINITAGNSPAFFRERLGPFSSGQASPEIVLMPADVEPVDPHHEPQITNTLSVHV